MGKLDFLKKKTKSYVLSWDGVTEGKEKVTELDSTSGGIVPDVYFISGEEYNFDMSLATTYNIPIPDDIKVYANFSEDSTTYINYEGRGMIISLLPNDDSLYTKSGGVLIYAAIPGAKMGNNILNPNYDVIFPKKGWWFSPSSDNPEDLAIVERPINSKASYTTSKSDKVGGAAPYKIMPYRSMVPGEYMVLYTRNVLDHSYSFGNVPPNDCESFSYLYYPDEILEIVDSEGENIVAEPSKLAHVTYEDILKIALYCEAETQQRCIALVTDNTVRGYYVSMISGSDAVVGTGDNVSYYIDVNSTGVFAVLSTSTGMIAGARIDDALIIDVGEVSGTFNSSGNTTFKNMHEVCVSEDMFSKICASYKTAYNDCIHYKGLAERGYYVDKGSKIKYCSLKIPVINTSDSGYIIPSEGVAFIVGSGSFASDVGRYGTDAVLAVHTKRHPKKTYDLVWDGVEEGKTTGGTSSAVYYYISDEEYEVCVPEYILINASTTYAYPVYMYNVEANSEELDMYIAYEHALRGSVALGSPIGGFMLTMITNKSGGGGCTLVYACDDNVTLGGGFFGNTDGKFPKRGWYFCPGSLSVDEPITIATVEAPN